MITRCLLSLTTFPLRLCKAWIMMEIQFTWNAPVQPTVFQYHRLGPEEIYQMAVYMQEMDTNPHNSPWHGRYEQEQSRSVKHFTVVIDLEGLNWNHMRPCMIDILGRVLLMSQNNYPFFAKGIILLRAPRIFKLVWSLAHPFVHDSVKKLIVFSTEHEYLEVIDRYMDRRVLPACICPAEGRGEGTLGFEKVKMEGGQLPSLELTDATIEELLEKDRTVLCSREHQATTKTERLHVYTQSITIGFLLEGSKRVVCQ
jgi:CRAL/TRIO domain